MTGRRQARDPGSLNMLQRRLTAAADDRKTTQRRLQDFVANVVVSQMLPSSVVKGGTGLKLRFGEALTRQTPDLDTAFRGDHAAFLDEFARAAAQGWGHFTAVVVEGVPRAPAPVPSAYAMQPYTVKLRYRNRPFVTVDVEVGYDELEATTDEPIDRIQSDEVLDLFAELGLPQPGPVPVLPLHHQIAQKIHACTEPGSSRAHDLVDLQLMESHVGDGVVARTCERLFRFRRQHTWPPTLTVDATWEEAYLVAAEGLAVLPDVHAAVTWLNGYVARLSQQH